MHFSFVARGFPLIYISDLFEVFVELRLPRYLPLVDLLVPERVLSEVLPVYSLDRVFL